jgi:WXG100 family type VII secretion target
MLTDPAQALIESEKLIKSANECQSIINEISGIIDELPSFWEGVSANIFAQNNQQVNERLNNIQKEMRNISQEIKELATVEL